VSVSSPDIVMPVRRVLRAVLAFSAARYVVAGVTATVVNVLARMALSLALPFAQAVAIAQGIGFLTGFLLYKFFVFTDARTKLPAQIAAFAAVNLVSFSVVISAAVFFRDVLTGEGAPLALTQFQAEALAHVTALACGSLINFLGHRLVTFSASGHLRRA